MTTPGAGFAEIANRQRTACDRIVATAEALHDIAQVYRRVDGQG